MSKTERLAQFGEGSRLARLVRRLGAWNGILAFGYHRVATADGPFDPGVCDATPALLEEQVRLLARECDVIGPHEVEDAIRRRRGRSVLLTFDDGYRDNVVAALPILERHGVCATFFVTTGFLDDGTIAWWDEIAWMVHASARTRLPAGEPLGESLSLAPQERRATIRRLIAHYKSLAPDAGGDFLDAVAEATASGRHTNDGHGLWMSWDDVRTLRAAGMHIGGHTVTHRVLSRLAPGEQQREIAGCRARIEAELGEPMRYFSYPDGGRDCFDEVTRRLLAEQGVELAFSLYGGYRGVRDWDRYDVRRRGLGPSASAERLALMATLPQVFAWP